MKKEIKILRDEDKHPIDDYSSTCVNKGHEIHTKVDNDLRLLNVVIMIISISLYMNLHSVYYLAPFAFCLLAFSLNMIVDKREQMLYFKMSECEYYEDTEVLFNKHWNRYGRWFNKVIWGSFVLGILSLIIVLL